MELLSGFVFSILVLYFDLLSILQDYHNLRAAAFNSQARELTQKTADLTESWGKCFVLYLTWGRVSAPTGCSPRDSGRLLSSRVGSSLTTSSYCFFFFCRLCSGQRRSEGTARRVSDCPSCQGCRARRLGAGTRPPGQEVGRPGGRPQGGFEGGAGSRSRPPGRVREGGGRLG